MVKAQVKIGGRGKAGGVKYAATHKTRNELSPRTSSAWTSKDTSSRNRWSLRLADIAEEYYLSFLLLTTAPTWRCAGGGRHGDRRGSGHQT